MLITPLYPTPTAQQAKNHILALIPVGQKNQIHGLLLALQNSIIKEVQSCKLPSSN